MPYLRILGQEFKKTMSYLKSIPSNLPNCEISWKNKNAQILDQKCLIWVFLGWNSKTILSYLKSAPSSLSNCEISGKKPKIVKFGTKNVLFGYFCARIWKQYCQIWNQLSRICLIANLWKMKLRKFRTKNALFGYFWVIILKNYCHI